MIPIYAHKSGEIGYDFAQFKEEFHEICLQHHKDHRALVFALILYDFGNPQIAKVLNDSDYWRALDKISGRYLSVFSFHAQQASFVPQRANTTYSKKAEIGLIYKIDFDYTNTSKTILDEYFETDSNIDFPAILFFQVDNSNVVGSRLVKVTAKKIEDAFEEIRSILQLAVDSLSEVEEKNFHNHLDLFNLLDRAFDDRNIKLLVKKIVRPAKEILLLLEKIGL